MNQLKKTWLNLVLAPIWFLFILIILSIYFSIVGIPEQEIAHKISTNLPSILLIIQVLLLSTLVLSSKKEGFSIFKNGWEITKSTLYVDIFVGIFTGIFIAILYFSILAPFQFYLQVNLGDYVPPGETMNVLGNQLVPFFIANVIFAPFVEESLYRNYALSNFSEKYSYVSTVLLNVCMFGLLHWLGGFWYILMTGLVVGLPFAIIALKRKNIVWVFVAHLTLNILEFIHIAMTKS